MDSGDSKTFGGFNVAVLIVKEDHVIELNLLSLVDSSHVVIFTSTWSEKLEVITVINYVSC